MVEVPAVEEADVVVVDALVRHSELLALLKRQVAAVVLPRGRRLDARPPPHTILLPGYMRAPEVGEPPAVAGREAGGSGACRGSTTPHGCSSSSSARTTSSWRWLCGRRLRGDCSGACRSGARARQLTKR
jgi:hypothetical protein